MTVVSFPTPYRGPNPAPVARPAAEVPTVADLDEETSRFVDGLLIAYYREFLEKQGTPPELVRMCLEAIPTGHKSPDA